MEMDMDIDMGIHMDMEIDMEFEAKMQLDMHMGDGARPCLAELCHYRSPCAPFAVLQPAAAVLALVAAQESRISRYLPGPRDGFPHKSKFRIIFVFN